MKAWYTAKELSDLSLPGLPGTKRNINRLAGTQEWPSRPRQKRGGGREFPVSALPEIARIELAKLTAPDVRKPKASPKKDAAPILVAVNANQKTKAEARAEIVYLCKNFIKSAALPLRRGRELFCSAWERGEIEAEPWVRDCFPTVSANSIVNWQRRILDAGNLKGLNSRYGQHRKGSGKIDQNLKISQLIIGMIHDHPHVSSKHVMQALRARFSGDDLPSYRSVQRWMANWKDKNAQEFLAIRSPDKHRSKYQAADGSYSAPLTRLNQLWEYDSTPADLLLADGSRANIVGVIDVFSRRLMLLVSKSSSSAAVASITRRAILAWGVPEAVKTDNGSDYVSHHMKRIFTALDIEQRICAPFSPEQKPHVERAFRTFSHGLLELMPGYVGHCVADRKEIEDRRAFSARLMKTGKDPIKLALTAEELQEFCDKWCNDIYLHDAHSGINNKTPFEMIAASSDTIRTIADERTLDVLLSEAPGDGFRIVGKKGIAINGTYYTAADLGGYEGQRVQVKFDETDFGQIWVFDDEEEFICQAISPEYLGVSRADVAAARKAKQKAHIAEKKKEMREASKAADTGNIVQEILTHRAMEAGKLVEMPKKTEEYQTDALTQAGRAVRHKDAPSEQPLTEKQKEIKARLDAGEQIIKPIKRHDTIDDQAQRFGKALELEQRIANADPTVDEADGKWLLKYHKTAEYRAQKRFREKQSAFLKEIRQ